MGRPVVPIDKALRLAAGLEDEEIIRKSAPRKEGRGVRIVDRPDAASASNDAGSASHRWRATERR